MNNLDKQYIALLQDILDNGVKKGDRTGTGTISVFGRQIRHKMSEGFPLLTTKKMHWKSIVIELLWFLRGDTNIQYLVQNGCHIWDGDAYKNYLIEDAKILPNMSKEKMIELGFRLTQEEFINRIKTDDEFSKKWGDLGPIYGKQWRSWNTHKTIVVGHNGYYNEFATIIIDQITNSINLLKTDPDSRRNRVSAWNVSEIEEAVLPPCHTDFQFYTRELSLEERWELYHKSDLEPLEPQKSVEDEELHRICTDCFIPTRAISLMWNQRSVDTFLGLPFNIASYGLLLEIIAKEVNMVPDELIGNLGDVHLYSNHIEQAKEQIGRELSLEEREHIYVYDYLGSDIGYNYDGDSELFDEAGIAKRTREPFLLPTLKINTEFWKTVSGECGIGLLDTNLQGFEIEDFQLENYQSHPLIKAPLSN